MEGGGQEEIPVHGRAARLRPGRREDHRYQPAHREFPRQSRRPSIRLRARPQQDRVAGDSPISDDLALKGRRALVTGGTQGIGAAVGARLREFGAKVLTTARATPAKLADANLFVAAGIATAEGCATLADAVRHRLDGADIIL